jgi:hypothetical protein
MKFVHFCDNKFRLNKKKKYMQACDYKPFGFWLSTEGCDYSWDNWCRREEFNLKGLKFKKTYKVDMNKLLQVITESDMDKFVQKFGVKSDLIKSNHFINIDWVRVADQYGGIYIPYNYKNRFKYSFYYGWDVDSVCVWDLYLLNSLLK